MKDKVKSILKEEGRLRMGDHPCDECQNVLDDVKK